MGNKKQKDEKRRFKLSKRWKISIVSIVILFVIALIGLGVILYGGRLIVNQEALILDTTTTLETTDGEVIGKLYNENRTLVPIDQIPDHVKDAFIAIEDQRFYEHAGVDIKSVFRAIYKDILAMSKVEGASTITQQLAKNLFLYNDKTWTRKTKEVMAAIYLEQKLSKDEILELYLNEIYFGNGLYGIETASNYFFSKSVHDLSIAEGALLAGLAKAPNGYSPINHPDKALNRRNTVLYSMEAAGMISTETRLTEEGKTIGLAILELEANPWADSYIDLVMKEASEKYQLSIDALKRGGYRIIINMDDDKQRIAYEKFQEESYFPGNTTGVEGAFTMMEQGTGKIIAALGGRNYQLGDLNRVTVKRQPGSTIKPIAVYGPAMMQPDKYQPYTILPDYATDYSGYVVSNADNVYANSVTIYDALKYSNNAATVWLLDEIGINYSKKYLQKMGINLKDEGLAIALGGLSEGVAPLQLMESYRTFANEGKMIDSHTIDRIYNRDGEMLSQAEPSETEVFSPQVAWNMTEILLEAVETGTATAGEFSKDLAGKTGSTQHPFVEGQTKDAWFVGYTPQYVTALWMGYDKSDKKHYLTGGSNYPTSLTKAILTEMDKMEPLVESFTKPDSVKDLPKPIILPEIIDLQASYEFGGFSIVKGKLSWQGSVDERVIYRIYREEDGIDTRVGEVGGETEFIINNALFKSNRYYIVPYDPLTKLEGTRSETIELSW
ncbi:transglycosylase domain-containing protein [Oceanobacillus chungangensis]|uniref:Penicillin-binding protein n=1 Tax=Oceanobacillus chungangensis TaxID=1229152 RepID=A0A3D8PUZ9_9BACI|nr:PBP1A family penicillin-binding protein [Oceanobacillus chungangensis]RDW19913.1 penicillin-binding protein [Oceanobacillus chungangensis]